MYGVIRTSQFASGTSFSTWQVILITTYPGGVDYVRRSVVSATQCRSDEDLATPVPFVPGEARKEEERYMNCMYVCTVLFNLMLGASFLSENFLDVRGWKESLHSRP
jgi:hypothetical protein